MQNLFSKILLAEGIDDQKVIEKLLKRRKITFENFGIRNCEGSDKLFKSLLPVIQVRSYDTMGVVLDADENLARKWENLKTILFKAGYEKIPLKPDSKGTILTDESGELPIIGIWLMPNNEAAGAIEDFVRFLIPERDELLSIAENKVDNLIAAEKNRFSKNQKSKAIIHTWLAWQERPGTLLGNAITYRFVKTQEYLLDDGKASNFINWLKKLFK